MEVATLTSISIALAAYVAGFGILGALIGLIFARRRSWLLLVGAFASTSAYVALCFREGIFSFRFPLWQIAVEFFLEQFAVFVLFCLLPTLLVASLVSSWRAKHWATHSNSI